MEKNSSIVFEDYLYKSIKKINNEENQRYDLSQVCLSEIEIEFLKGLAQGRDYREINIALKLNKKSDSYSATSKRLLTKFKATSLAHVMYKAMKTGIID